MARVGRVLLYVCVKCGHASALRRLDGRPKAKGTGHALNARMLGTPLVITLIKSQSFLDRRYVVAIYAIQVPVQFMTQMLMAYHLATQAPSQ